MTSHPNPPHPNPWGDAATPYLELGGDPRVHELAAAFYATVDAESPTLRAMLPHRLEGSITKFYPIKPPKGTLLRIPRRHSMELTKKDQRIEKTHLLIKTAFFGKIANPLLCLFTTRCAEDSDRTFIRS